MSKNQKLMQKMQLFVALGLLLAACSGGGAAGGPPAGWQKYDGDGFEIYLPESYEGGTDQADLAGAAQLLHEGGNEALAQAIETSNYLLYAVDSSDDFGTSLNILKEQNPALIDMTVSAYVDLAISQLEGIAGITILESEAIVVSGFEAWRVTEEYDLAALMGVEGTTKVVQYLLKSGDSVWILSYGTTESEFNARLPEFEQSLATFKEI